MKDSWFNWKCIITLKIFVKNLDEKYKWNKKLFPWRKKAKAQEGWFFLIIASTSTGCISIPAFASLLDVSIRIMSSEIGIKICAIAAKTKTYKLIIKKKKKKHYNMVFLAKSKLNGIEFLISKTLCDSLTSHDEFVLINYVLKE